MSRLLAVLLVLLPAAAAAQQNTLPLTVAYRCDDGERLLVEYARDRDGRSERAIVTRGMKRWKMTRQVAGSGERYLDEKSGFEWWAKGPTGSLMQGSGKAVECRELVPPRKK